MWTNTRYQIKQQQARKKYVGNFCFLGCKRRTQNENENKCRNKENDETEYGWLEKWHLKRFTHILKNKNIATPYYESECCIFFWFFSIFETIYRYGNYVSSSTMNKH